VGGLADTIEDFDGWRKGTGFLFQDYDHRAMVTAVRRALELFRDRRAWHAMMKRGMALDFSWARSAEQYRALYRSLVEG
jgi:starch synthase